MTRTTVILFCTAAVLFIPSITCAVERIDKPVLFSPLTAETFHKTAYEIYNSHDLAPAEIDQAMNFLYAVVELDPRASYAWEDILNVGSKSRQKEYAQLMLAVIQRYAERSDIDLETCSRATDYLLGISDSREQREQFLQNLLKISIRRSQLLSSDITMQLGLLAAERADYDSATAYLMNAYNTNPYNRVAFAKLDEITRQRGQALIPTVYLRYLRLAMRSNPLDIDAAFAFAQYAQSQQMYDVASSAYRYCADLFRYRNPGVNLPPNIYLPWAISSYNTQRNRNRCIQIADMVSQQGTLDVVLDGIAMAAAEELGNQEHQKKFRASALKAEEILTNDPESSLVRPLQLAWFYSFVTPSKEKALAWANIAFAAQSEDPQVKAIFAYTMAINDQPELAQEYAQAMAGSNQIAAVTNAVVKLATDERDSAIEMLKAAIDMDPASIVSHHARRLLIQNGSEYISSATPSQLQKALETEFAPQIVPEFTPVGELFSAKLDLTGTEFSYGRAFGTKLVITNNSKEPLVISEHSLFTGNIRVDAQIRGDISASIPRLITRKIRPGKAVEPGGHIAIPMDIHTNGVRKLLLTHPQAALEIEFKTYLDPVEDEKGNVFTSIPGTRPITAVVKREAVDLSRSYLMQRLDALKTGKEGQKVRAVQLFTGLLAEQDIMKSQPMYRYVKVNRTILVDALRKGLADENWKVKIQAMSNSLLQPPLDYELVSTLSQNLNHSQWPVRLMALYTLAQYHQQGFKNVLDYSAQYDENWIVRKMAVSLGGKEPPRTQPETSENNEQNP